MLEDVTFNTPTRFGGADGAGEELCAYDDAKDDIVATTLALSKQFLHCKKLKVILTLLWLFELQLEYSIATAGKRFLN